MEKPNYTMSYQLTKPEKNKSWACGLKYKNVLGGYALVNLYASTRLARDYTLLARIDNLADKDYQLARTYATAGRTVYVGVKWAPQ